MPRPVPVEPCPRCHERALVSGECRGCGHLEPERLEACDGEAPVGAARDLAGARVSRPWIAGRGLPGALASGPLAAGALGALVVLGPELPRGAAALLAVSFAALAWTFVAMLANATTIEIRGGRLAVRHGPVPMPGLRAVAVPATEVERLELRREPGAGDLGGAFALVVHAPGGARTVYVSSDREEAARTLRFLREALPRPRRSPACR